MENIALVYHTFKFCQSYRIPEIQRRKEKTKQLWLQFCWNVKVMLCRYDSNWHNLFDNFYSDPVNVISTQYLTFIYWETIFPALPKLSLILFKKLFILLTRSLYDKLDKETNVSRSCHSELLNCPVFWSRWKILLSKN